MELKGEVWKDVPGYEGLYMVSSFGRVKSIPHEEECLFHGKKSKRIRPGRVLIPHIGWDGYIRFILCKNGKRSTIVAHRIVASAFLEKPENCDQINHKDEDKMNNRIENLEWCNAKYNSNYGFGALNRGECLKQPIKVLDGRSGELLGEFSCYADAAKELGVSLVTIARYASQARPKSDLFTIIKLNKNESRREH